MKSLKKVWNVISSVLVVIVVVLAVALMGARLVGLSVYTVISGSMQPTYNVGDLIYVKKVSAETIQKGDPITFVLNDDLVVATHRVVEIDSENQRFYTKGDANDAPDANPVHFKNLIGKPVFKIPYLGYVSDWIQHPPGLYISVTCGAVLVLLAFLPDLIKGKDKKEEDEKNKTA